METDSNEKLISLFAMAISCLLQDKEGIVVRDNEDRAYIVWIDGAHVRVRPIEDDEVAYTEADMTIEQTNNPFKHGCKLWIHDDKPN